MKIKLNVDMGVHKAGAVIDVPDRDGIPLDRHWRDLLKDAKIDNCCEVQRKSTMVQGSKPKAEAEVADKKVKLKSKKTGDSK